MSSTISLTRASALNNNLGWLRRHLGVLIGLVVFAFWGLGALAAPLTLASNPLQQNINDSLEPPGATHWWGADKLGRDIYTRVVYGARISLPAGIIAVIASMTIGTTIGALAGYFGGLWDELLMRITDVFLAFPTIILAMAIAAALGPS